MVISNERCFGTLGGVGVEALAEVDDGDDFVRRTMIPR